MKYSTVIFLLILLPLTAAAKDTTNTGSGRFQLGIHFSPDYNFRTLKNNSATASSEAVIESRNNLEIPRMGCTAGFGILWNIKKKFALELGIHYSRKGYQTAWIEIPTFTIPHDPAIPQRYKQKYKFVCVDLPLIAHFKFGEKKLSFAACAGVVTNLILYERVETIKDYGGGEIKRTRSHDNYIYNPVNFSPVIGLGANLRLGKKLDLKVLPTFRYGMLQIIDAPVTGYLWNAGLDIGLYIDL